MTHWHSNSRKHSRKNLAAEMELTQAYRAVFKGHPDVLQQQAVLADLAAGCGWNKVTLPSVASDRELWFAEGMRAAFGLIFAHLSLSPEDVEALANAARREAALSSQ